MRRTLIRLHLWVASFLSAILLMIAISGGFYLFGEKGQTTATPLSSTTELALDMSSENLEADVLDLLTSLGESPEFEYLKLSGTTITTRPTSKTYHELTQSAGGWQVTRHEPDWLKTIVELHKGHGPMWFKRFQQLTAAGLVFILLTGLWLGLSASALRTQTTIAVGSGVLVFLVLALV